MADNCLRRDANGGKIVPKGRSIPPEETEIEIPQEIWSLIKRCQARVMLFENDEMSVALKFGEMLFRRLGKMAEHYDDVASSLTEYPGSSITATAMRDAAKDMRHVLRDCVKDL